MPVDSTPYVTKEDPFEDLPPVYYRDGVRYGTGMDMIEEIEKLREAFRRYVDPFLVGTVHPESLQQAIDRAFGDTSTEI